MSENEALYDRAVDHQIDIRGWERGLLKDIRELLIDSQVEFTARLDARLERLSQVDIDRITQGKWTGSTRLEELNAFLEGYQEQIEAELSETLEPELIELAETEVDFQASSLTRSVASLPTEATVTVGKPSINTLKATVQTKPLSGKTLKEWTSDWSTSTVQRVEQQIRIGMVEGVNPNVIARRLRGTKASGYKDGILEISRRSAETIARTAVTDIQNEAAQQSAQENEDILQGLRWTSVLDGRTSAICRSRDGKVYPLDTKIKPPAHPNCRSFMTQVLKSWRQMGLKGLSKDQRDALDGKSKAGETYRDWFARQTVKKQREILGDTKYKLWKSGDFTHDSFVSRSGNILTLKQIRDKNRDAYDAALTA